MARAFDRASSPALDLADLQRTFLLHPDIPYARAALDLADRERTILPDLPD